MCWSSGAEPEVGVTWHHPPETPEPVHQGGRQVFPTLTAKGWQQSKCLSTEPHYTQAGPATGQVPKTEGITLQIQNKVQDVLLTGQSERYVDQGLETMALEPSPAPCLFLLIKFYWHTATPTGFLTIPSHWPELSSCNKDSLACRVKNIYSLAFYRRSLPLPGIDKAAICVKRK